MNTAKLVNKIRVFGALAILLLGVTTLPLSNALAAEGFSYEQIDCLLYDIPFSITVLMPKGLTDAEKETTAEKMCLSVHTKGLDIETIRNTKAVCDTDMNCEYWDRYHVSGNIEKIFVAFDDEKTNTRMLVILCKDATSLIFTNNEAKLATICKENRDAKP